MTQTNKQTKTQCHTQSYISIPHHTHDTNKQTHTQCYIQSHISTPHHTHDTNKPTNKQIIKQANSAIHSHTSAHHTTHMTQTNQQANQQTRKQCLPQSSLITACTQSVKSLQCQVFKQLMTDNVKSCTANNARNTASSAPQHSPPTTGYRQHPGWWKNNTKQTLQDRNKSANTTGRTEIKMATHRNKNGNTQK